MSSVDRRLAWAVFLFTAALFARATSGAFVLLDDYAYVIDNPLVNEGLSLDGILRSFTESREGNWHPLTWISHALDVQLHGLAPFGHHLTSVLLHAATATFLFVLLLRLTLESWSAFFAAALFAWHPLRVESVAWVAERKDVLSGLFFVTTLWTYVRWTERPSPGRYALTAFFLALGLASKSMLVTLPCVLLLLDAWPLQRVQSLGWSRLVREKVPLFLLAGALAIATFLTQDAEGATTSFERLPPGLRLENALISYAVYLGQFLWPFGLGVFYPHAADLDPEAARTLLGPAAGSLVLLVALSIWAWRYRRTSPWFAFGLAWAGLMLLPVIGLVQVGAHAHADRYTYLPAIGVSISLAYFLGRSLRTHARLAGLLGLSVLAATSVLTWNQLGVWRTTVTLFEHTLAVTERNPLAHHILARALLADDGEDAVEHALEQLHLARELKPRDPELSIEIGDLYYEIGDFERAGEAYARARELDADGHRLHLSLGLVAWRLGRPAAALSALQRAEERAPTPMQAVESWEELGALQLTSGAPQEAARSYARCVELLPGDPIAHFNLGNARERAGNRTGAIDAYRRSLELEPELSEAALRLRELEERSQ